MHGTYYSLTSSNSYRKNAKQSTFCCFIDMEKAFGNVNSKASKARPFAVFVLYQRYCVSLRERHCGIDISERNISILLYNADDGFCLITPVRTNFSVYQIM